MEWLPAVLSGALIVLVAVLAVVGVQVVMVLSEFRRTLTRINNLVDEGEARLQAIVRPLQNLGGMASGLSTGMKVFETFVQWLNRERDRK